MNTTVINKNSNFIEASFRGLAQKLNPTAYYIAEVNILIVAGVNEFQKIKVGSALLFTKSADIVGLSAMVIDAIINPPEFLMKGTGAGSESYLYSRPQNSRAVAISFKFRV
jgi:hypothetical protein